MLYLWPTRPHCTHISLYQVMKFFDSIVKLFISGLCDCNVDMLRLETAMWTDLSCLGTLNSKWSSRFASDAPFGELTTRTCLVRFETAKAGVSMTCFTNEAILSVGFIPTHSSLDLLNFKRHHLSLPILRSQRLRTYSVSCMFDRLSHFVTYSCPVLSHCSSQGRQCTSRQC